jgi:translation initiation factor 1
VANSRLVYSTDESNICSTCSKVFRKCKCTETQSTTKDDIVRVSRETKGRKGAGVTVITGLNINPAELKEIAKQLKIQCGAGGTTKSGQIEIQGDKREIIKNFFEKGGKKVKLSGG